MAIFWSSKGDRVKRLLVRRCSHSAQQHQREQLNRDADVDAAIELVNRDAIRFYGLVNGAAERLGADRRFQCKICRAHPYSGGNAGGLCARVSAVAGDAEKADFT
jgi:hypothetical protein